VCTYSTTKTIQGPQPEKSSQILKIILAIIIVIMIHLLTFIVVMNKKLHKVKKLLNEKKK
ncbi:MAG: hypothetical protein KC535_05710, partial [Nanoarchaeota archaeon]|nr:hypothetical protein [Nanoarchaeota archaeon]